MENVGYLAYARASQLERATDVAANNIANANTAGFRASRTLFENYVAQSNAAGDLGAVSYAIDRGTVSDLSQGALTRTGNPLDIAITGDGWLGYLTTTGQTALGREGSLVQNAAGDLSTTAGDLLLDLGGAPINIPPGSGEISIARDGTISGGNGEVIAQVGVFDAPDIAFWERLSGTMMVPRDGVAPLNPTLEPALMQGHVEQSNVSPIAEMSRLIELQRAYEHSMSLAKTADDLRKEALSRLRSNS
ncbi:flagellar hook-basal body complex protein [Sulfitobacter aestuarii]|uniref:Flagellar hook-basal body complex protein n=1 Tax=Sulfitobacter aestuarii TaxID=2161676 RepID=A0ABW5U4A3_9RHOB